ncbi:MAG: hypothetical protein J7L17_03555 [Thaumarchaeota archaeon]|nr:hypothetical protein [Nitrososphaerota archaeon]
MREEKAVSTVLGIAILVAIVFLVILPLLIFLQNTAALYNLAVSERNRLELERMQERLEVHASISPEDHKLRILLLNNGPLTVNITRVYVMSDSLPTPERDLKERVLLSPSSGVTVLGPDKVKDMPEIEEGSEYFIDVTTSRGKTYSAPENPLSVTDPPYLLQVTLMNMKYGEKYSIEVGVDAINGEKVGCIRIESPSGSSYPCTDSATVEYLSERWNENKTFAFRVMPGNYTITVKEGATTVSSQSMLLLGNEARIYNFTHTPPCPSGDCCDDMRDSLKIKLSAPKVVIAGSDEETPPLEVYVIIELEPDAREAIKDLTVELDCTGVTCTPPTQEKTIAYLEPGQTVALKYEITADIGSWGDYFYLTAKITGGTGVRSGFSYDYSSCHYDSGQISVSGCRLTTIKYINCTGWLDPGCKKSVCESNPECDWVGWPLELCICTSHVIPRCKIPP